MAFASVVEKQNCNKFSIGCGESPLINRKAGKCFMIRAGIVKLSSCPPRKNNPRLFPIETPVDLIRTEIGIIFLSKDFTGSAFIEITIIKNETNFKGIQDNLLLNVFVLRTSVMNSMQCLFPDLLEIGMCLFRLRLLSCSRKILHIQIFEGKKIIFLELAD
jgi:hypothetical protein